MNKLKNEKTIVYKRSGTVGTLTLHGRVDIFEAQALHAAGQRALADTRAVSVYADFMGAERLDLSALQILVALQRDLEDAGRTLTVEKPETLAVTLKQTGFSL